MSEFTADAGLPADSDLETKAEGLMENGDLEEAVKLLSPVCANSGSAPLHMLLGIALFQQQKYEAAVRHFAAVLSVEPSRGDAKAMLKKASGNAVSRVDVFVPTLALFDRSSLLSESRISPGTLPGKHLPSRYRGWLGTASMFTGHCVGWLGSMLMNGLTNLWGRVAGYQDEIWTNWYRRSIFRGVLTLAYMREKLHSNNLHSTYPPGTLIGFQTTGLKPPQGARYYRTTDGSWNNLNNPKEGAAGTRFLRNIDVASIEIDPNHYLMDPNPREVSRKLLTRDGPMKEVPFLNLLAAAWIQFENHDWVSHGEVLQKDFHEIPLQTDDPIRRLYRQANMFVGKTQPDPTRKDAGEPAPITFINEVTHWWDASQLYGSDQVTADRLRSGRAGKLQLDVDGMLPLTPDGVEDTGFVRNWWVGLAMLHTLFAREHNAICDYLKVSYPYWDDNRLYHVARLINAAVMAKIHTVEWTPAILPNPILTQGLHANWFGIATNLFKTGKHRKTLADINISNPELGGVVGNPIDKHGQPFGLTEEFVEVYRLHSLMPEVLAIRRLNSASNINEIPVADTRQAGSAGITGKYSMADLFFSFGQQHPGQLVLNNFPPFMQEISIPGNPMLDLGAVDILRARERGVPRYNAFRRHLGLKPIRTFEDLTTDTMQLTELKTLYGDNAEDVEKLDLLIGTLAECDDNRPDKCGFGETLLQIFILNATRRLQADRFYTDFYNEQTYTREGLQWIDNVDMKSVILRHLPELADTGLANVRNAFEPWDDVERLDAERHPLRAYDKQLGDDPWTGDKYRDPSFG